MYKNIIFDFGNVLFDIDLPKIATGFRQLMGDEFDKSLAKLHKNNIFELYETGGLGTDEFVDAIRYSVSPPLSEEAVVAVWNSIFVGMPTHRFDLLLALRGQYQVFLLSNINELHADWIDRYMEKEHGIGDFQNTYFDGVYYSHLIRLRKPNTDIYEYVLQDAEIKPHESLFFDDLKENSEAARQVGIQGIWHEPGTEIVDRV